MKLHDIAIAMIVTQESSPFGIFISDFWIIFPPWSMGIINILITIFLYIILQVMTITNEIPLITMAYAASSVSLSDRQRYPFFLRTNPPDDLQAHFMVKLLEEISSKDGNDVNAVSVIYTDGLYGRTGYEVRNELVMSSSSEI